MQDPPHHDPQPNSSQDQISVRDEEATIEKLPYPKSVFFIISNEFCERFSFYGMRTILILYLTDILRYAESDAKIVYHTFTMFAYFFPLLGSILSDSWLGKFRTILYVSMIYAAGSILLALSATEPLKIPQAPFSILALFLIALGTGGIKPCVSAFGGDQFVVPQQELQLATFFSLFYFSINAGGMISTLLTPILRNDVQCFDRNSCFPLAFAVPGVLMVLSIGVFAMGKPMYKIKNPKGNVVVNVVKCMWYAVTHRSIENPGNHWLDRSEAKYGTQLVTDIKFMLKVLVIYIPLPIFSALYDQQGSGWTFQAVRMNGDIGFYTILPDQMQVVNPILILAFIPLFTYGVFPLLAKCNLLKTPLQKMCCGGFLSAVAFAVSACVSIALENTYPVLPSAGEAQVRIYDTTNCQYSFSTLNNVVPGSSINGYYLDDSVKISDKTQTVAFIFDPATTSTTCVPRDISIEMKEEVSYGVYINQAGPDYYVDDIEKSEDGFPLVRYLTYDNTKPLTYTYIKKSKSTTINAGNTSLFSMENQGTYKIDGIDQELVFKLGGTYTVVLQEQNTVNLIEVTKSNSIHILWLLPQYFIITAAEIMYSITGLEFSYSQSPVSMKSVLQACLLMTIAIGNLIIVVIESLKIFKLQSNDFFLYTGLMVVDMFIFMWLAIRYKYEIAEDTSVEEMAAPEKKKLSNGIDNPTFDKND